MEVSHKSGSGESQALDSVREYQVIQRQRWQDGRPLELETFERELHAHVMDLERELLAEELARYDVDVPEVEIEGVTYRRALESTETYLSAAGPVTVERHLYRPAGRSSKSICPLELRAGIVDGLCTPRAARLCTYALAQLTSCEAEAFFAEIGNMTPMSWRQEGGQTVLSLRSLIQSDRWDRAWALLSDDFCMHGNVFSTAHQHSMPRAA